MPVHASTRSGKGLSAGPSSSLRQVDGPAPTDWKWAGRPIARRTSSPPESRFPVVRRSLGPTPAKLFALLGLFPGRPAIRRRPGACFFQSLVKIFIAGISAMLVVAASGPVQQYGLAAQSGSSVQGAKAPALKPDEVDRLLAPVALYPDQLLAQMLLCATNPGRVAALAEWLASNQTLKGADLQDAAVKSGFDPSFVALVVFPDVIDMMAGQPDWTRQLGQAFSADRTAVFASIQRLRAKASDAGTLKSTAQQDVETRTTSSGQQVIVIEPANPQVVYVPQYNPQVVYTRQQQRRGRSECDWLHCWDSDWGGHG